MKKESCNCLKLLCTLIGAAVAIGAIVFTVIHFWDNIKSLLPCKAEDDFEDDFEDEAEDFEDADVTPEDDFEDIEV